MYYNISVMKKLIMILILYFIPVCSFATNPFMGDKQNQIAFNLGQGVNSGIIVPPPTQLVPFYLLHLQYSQPTTFFRIPARRSINIAQTIGFGSKYNWDWDKYTIPMIFLSEDFALLHGKNWYFSTGIGVGMQAQQNERIGSKLIFQFKLIGGYRITDKIGLELFIHHFSNGNTAEENNSYAFYGTGFTYSF